MLMAYVLIKAIFSLICDFYKSVVIVFLVVVVVIVVVVVFFFIVNRRTHTHSHTSIHEEKRHGIFSQKIVNGFFNYFVYFAEIMRN